MPDATWVGAGIGRHQLDVNRWCLEMGGHCRTGLEDNVRWDKSRLAKSNAELVSRVAPSRNPFVPTSYELSPDGRWLATALRDAGRTNLWANPTAGGPMRQLTDFGLRPTLIARQVTWAPDGASIYAAVVETDADVVLLNGLLP